MAEHDDGTLRTFETGATRDTAEGKLDYEGFLSPLVLQRFAQYMDEHRVQSDGTLRDSDNWQKGIPLDQYMKSGWRHFFDWWAGHRGGSHDMEALCALLFNVMGYMHEALKAATRKEIGQIIAEAQILAGASEKQPFRIQLQGQEGQDG
jgi:hypothetical protein